MGGPRDYHTKWSKLERERQIPDDIIYMGNLKHNPNELTTKQSQQSPSVECLLLTSALCVFSHFLLIGAQGGR